MPMLLSTKKTPDRLAGAFPFHVALEMDMYSRKPLPVACGFD
jgi:hypothetical protein